MQGRAGSHLQRSRKKSLPLRQARLSRSGLCVREGRIGDEGSVLRNYTGLDTIISCYTVLYYMYIYIHIYIYICIYVYMYYAMRASGPQ